jgi:hypothetical protein
MGRIMVEVVSDSLMEAYANGGIDEVFQLSERRNTFRSGSKQVIAGRYGIEIRRPKLRHRRPGS